MLCGAVLQRAGDGGEGQAGKKAKPSDGTAAADGDAGLEAAADGAEAAAAGEHIDPACFWEPLGDQPRVWRCGARGGCGATGTTDFRPQMMMIGLLR